jgi:flagellar basal-body rod protein FlgC
MRYEPDHPLANADGYVAYPNVNVVQEMADMISATRSFQMNVEVLNSAKSLAERVLTLGQ